MKLAAITFWHKMPIAVMLSLSLAYVAKVEGALPRRQMKQLYFTSLINDDNYEEKNENDRPNYSHIDMEQDHFAPRFKAPNKMRKMEFPYVGSSITLSCAAEGNPTPNITWYDNENTRKYFQLYDKWSIVLEDLNVTKDIQSYTCVVCNQLGCINHTTELYVIGEKIIQLHHMNLTNDNNHKETIENDRPNYGHIDMNQDHYAPRFKAPYKMREMEFPLAGSSIILSCAAEGNPTPNITWYKKENTRKYFQLYGKWSIVLEELNKTEDGFYTCVVCNQLGCINHTTVLYVQERYPSKPYIKNHGPGNVTAVVDGTVILSCPLVSDLEPYLYWNRPYNYSVNDVEVGSTDIPIPNGLVIESEDPFDKPGQLTIYNVTKEDEGWYMCVAVNTIGNATATGFLTVLESEPIQEASDNVKFTLTMSLTIALGTAIFVAVLIVVMTCNQLKREKKRKQRDIEIARAVIETYWIKKVTVEKPHIDSSPNATNKTLIKPVVKIEKQKVSRVQNKTSGAMMISEYELQVDIEWEVPRETLALGKVLGQGEFGKVVKAECVGVLKSRMQPVVAVKMLKEGHTDAEMIALVSEMEMMKLIGKHVNIINLLGCCTQDGPLFVIVEYAPNGNLREFLRNHRPENRHKSPTEVLKENTTLREKDLVWFSYQVARGMEYLTSRQCIHCDLAARNVLVTHDYILKIADFGLAKDVQSKGYYRKQTEGKLPARWMAPESLSDIIFNTQTDVWSFGVLLWEIMTLGAMPYPKVPGQFLYQYLSAGHRLQKPLLCSLEIYMLMCKCWSFSAGDRPSFTKLVEDLEKILTDIENHIPHLRATMELETKVKKLDL